MKVDFSWKGQREFLDFVNGKLEDISNMPKSEGRDSRKFKLEFLESVYEKERMDYINRESNKKRSEALIKKNNPRGYYYSKMIVQENNFKIQTLLRAHNLSKKDYWKMRFYHRN